MHLPDQWCYWISICLIFCGTVNINGKELSVPSNRGRRIPSDFRGREIPATNNPINIAAENDPLKEGLTDVDYSEDFSTTFGMRVDVSPTTDSTNQQQKPDDSPSQLKDKTNLTISEKHLPDLPNSVTPVSIVTRVRHVSTSSVIQPVTDNILESVRSTDDMRFLSDEVPGWAPNWPSDLILPTVSGRRPTVRFPTLAPTSVEGLHRTPTPSEGPQQPNSENVQFTPSSHSKVRTNSNEMLEDEEGIMPSGVFRKVPITQYFFDQFLGPSVSAGPLFEPEQASSRVNPGPILSSSFSELTPGWPKESSKILWNDHVSSIMTPTLSSITETVISAEQETLLNHLSEGRRGSLTGGIVSPPELQMTAPPLENLPNHLVEDDTEIPNTGMPEMGIQDQEIPTDSSMTGEIDLVKLRQSQPPTLAPSTEIPPSHSHRTPLWQRLSQTPATIPALATELAAITSLSPVKPSILAAAILDTVMTDQITNVANVDPKEELVDTNADKTTISPDNVDPLLHSSVELSSREPNLEHNAKPSNVEAHNIDLTTNNTTGFIDDVLLGNETEILRSANLNMNESKVEKSSLEAVNLDIDTSEEVLNRQGFHPSGPIVQFGTTQFGTRVTPHSFALSPASFDAPDLIFGFTPLRNVVSTIPMSPQLPTRVLPPPLLHGSANPHLLPGTIHSTPVLLGSSWTWVTATHSVTISMATPTVTPAIHIPPTTTSNWVHPPSMGTRLFMSPRPSTPLSTNFASSADRFPVATPRPTRLPNMTPLPGTQVSPTVPLPIEQIWALFPQAPQTVSTHEPSTLTTSTIGSDEVTEDIPSTTPISISDLSSPSTSPLPLSDIEENTFPTEEITSTPSPIIHNQTSSVVHTHPPEVVTVPLIQNVMSTPLRDVNSPVLDEPFGTIGENVTKNSAKSTTTSSVVKSEVVTQELPVDTETTGIVGASDISSPISVTTELTTEQIETTTERFLILSTVQPSTVKTTIQTESPDLLDDTTDSGPSLTNSITLANGTVVDQSMPYLKVLLSLSPSEFCLHREGFRALFSHWMNLQLKKEVSITPSEIHFFHSPHCETMKPTVEEPSDNRLPRDQHAREPAVVTAVYFVVMREGKIDPELTQKFPLFPMQFEIGEELTYLRSRVSQLELIQPDFHHVNSDLVLELETGVLGTSLLVVIVLSCVVVVTLLLGGAVMIWKKHQASENYYGRRCTPVSMDAYSMDSVSVFHNSFRRRRSKRASNKSIKSFLNHAFDDPNGPSQPLNFAKLTLAISDIDAVYDEFTSIPVNMPKYDEMPSGIHEKNRYANVIPVPETRVLLKVMAKETSKCDYINANYVKGPRNEPKHYIATQAPLDNTVADFWRMIWEQESRVIVMLTDFVEKGIDKCADYLPPSETLDCHRVYGDYQVTLKSRDMREKFVVSVVQLKNLESSLTREVTHVWYTAWPASGVPNEESAFISFIMEVRRTRKKLRAKGPVVVHCSPGTGRSGTFMACDFVMKQFDDQRTVDVPKTVYAIRRDRAGAVQTKEQYAFVYRVANLYASKLTSGNLESL